MNPGHDHTLPSADLSPEQRLAEIAVVLARGVRRLHSRLQIGPPNVLESWANLANSGTGNGLDFSDGFRPDRLALVNAPQQGDDR